MTKTSYLLHIVLLLYGKKLAKLSFLAAPCGSPTNGEETVAVDTSISYVFGDTYTYVCNNGYEYSGEVESTCQSDGTWSLSPPTCTCEICNGSLQLVHMFCTAMISLCGTLCDFVLIQHMVTVDE